MAAFDLLLLAVYFLTRFVLDIFRKNFVGHEKGRFYAIFEVFRSLKIFYDPQGESLVFKFLYFDPLSFATICALLRGRLNPLTQETGGPVIYVEMKASMMDAICMLIVARARATYYVAALGRGMRPGRTKQRRRTTYKTIKYTINRRLYNK